MIETWQVDPLRRHLRHLLGVRSASAHSVFGHFRELSEFIEFFHPEPRSGFAYLGQS
jgi:hypothetical protein